MTDEQTLHLVIKQPPNPNPIKTLGIFSDFSHPDVQTIILQYLSKVVVEPNDTLKENLKDEVLKAISSGKVVAAQREGKLFTIHILQE